MNNISNSGNLNNLHIHDSLFEIDFEKRDNHQNSPSVSNDKVDLSGSSSIENDKKKWTVLAYMNGKTNIYPFLYDKLDALEAVGSNEDVNIVAEIGCAPPKKMNAASKALDKISGDKQILTVRRYYVTQDPNNAKGITSPVVEDLGSRDMGNAENVAQFLEWGIKNYPAEHYAIIFNGHGDGYRGVLYDDIEKTHVSLDQLSNVVLKRASDAAGKPIDVVNFDNCLMGQLEVAYAVKDHASYMVASEETEKNHAQPLEKVMKNLQDTGGNMTPEDLSKLFVYEAFHGEKGQVDTLSAIDLSKIQNVSDAAGQLSDVLAQGNVKSQVIINDIKKTLIFGGGKEDSHGYRDIGHFSEILSSDKRIKDENVKNAALNLKNSVNDAVIAEQHSGIKYRNATGLSVHLPIRFIDTTEKDYADTEFAKNTSWDETFAFITHDTDFQNLLKKLGASEGTTDFFDKFADIGSLLKNGLSSQVSKLTTSLLDVSALVARIEPLSSLTGKDISGFLGVGSQLASKIGVLGGTYTAFKGIKGFYEVSQEIPANTAEKLSKRKGQIDSLIKTSEGAALIAVNTALLLGASAGIVVGPALLAFALPVAKIVYDKIAAKSISEESLKQESLFSEKTVYQKLDEINQAGGRLER